MNGDGDAHVAARQISSMDALVDHAADVAALLVEWAVMLRGTGSEDVSYANEMQARIHRPKVEEETLAPIEAGKKETKRASERRNSAVREM